jgi:aminopeptidase
VAFGQGFPFLIDDPAELKRSNESELHLDFMIGSDALEVTGITAGGERVPVLRDGRWQI